VLERSSPRTPNRDDPFLGEAPQVKGIGVDAVEIERFRRSLERTPTMRTRLFTAAGARVRRAEVDPVPSLAARFAHARR
jgi:hypothetical protein